MRTDLIIEKLLTPQILSTTQLGENLAAPALQHRSSRSWQHRLSRNYTL